MRRGRFCSSSEEALPKLRKWKEIRETIQLPRNFPRSSVIRLFYHYLFDWSGSADPWVPAPAVHARLLAEFPQTVVYDASIVPVAFTGKTEQRPVKRINR